ncbi:PEP-CTERM sorting domain-containing protein [Paucibacter sp. R3-3]|uniref:PEP-CTERM sorting domain-containing protein n=1 Tax=Roseateles agri TaxID=3098619 RepID=A0ABU5DEC3_9BURK|nr:PEP-CTERM sorting domain-containing protein [Paucibacter sp. R3-3]MDY0744626.1 PEP-CTERM sorting domain-containing protein [Paucibacter sp. R3-3]
MKKAFTIALALAMAAGAQFASATVLNFDDLSGNADPVPTNYGGLDWSASGWVSFNGSDSSDPYTPHSGSNVITLSWDGTDALSLVRFGQAATFDGAWFSGYAEGDVTFQLFYQGQLVGTSATLDPSATPSFLASGYAGLVDAVGIKSNAHAFYVMDDFTFTAAVPEPSVTLLMLAGLGATGFVAARRRRAQGDAA